MRIGIDFRNSNPSRRDEGMLRAIFETMFRLAEEDEFVLYCEEENKGAFRSFPSNTRLTSLPAREYSSQLSHHALSERLDVLIRCSPSDEILVYPSERQLALVMDLAYHFESVRFDNEYLKRRRYEVWATLKEAGAIGTPSDYLRWTLYTHPARNWRDVFVVPPTWENAKPEDPANWTASERSSIPTLPFFFYPSDVNEYSNHVLVCQAFRKFLSRSKSHCELVLAGRMDGWPALRRQSAGLPLRHLGEVRSGCLKLLYQRARAVLFLPDYANHGQPLIEAFRVGVPVLCSNLDGLREVGGNAVLRCQPEDVDEMARLMDRVSNHGEIRQRLIAAGRERATHYGSEPGAAALLEACQRIAEDAIPLRSSRNRTWQPLHALEKYGPGPLRRLVKQLYLKSWHGISSCVSGISKPMRRHVQAIRAMPSLMYARVRRRLQKSLAPKLGILQQHSPRTLTLPVWYARVRPPRNPPTISIVTPSFNHAVFLEKTIESVLQQRYPRLEYIVQDGGSEDQTQELLERYRPFLKHCESGPDKGQTNAINLGFRHATGEVLAWLNSDDLLLPGSLASVARFFARHPNVDVVYGHRIIIDENGAEVGRWIMPSHGDDAMIWADYIPQETLFWRRRIWEKVGGALDESFHFAMDWDLLIRFREAGARFARLPRFLGAFRFHAAQKTTARMEDLGRPEIERILARYHGREVSQQEIFTQIQPFLRRHVRYCRLREFLPFLG